MSLSARLAAALPSGRTLPTAAWGVRHAWMVRVVWAHAAVILVWGLVMGYAVWHAALDAAPIAIAGVIAAVPRLSRRARAAAVCIGLLSSSAVFVHLMDGAVEGHFHFFVMVTLLALYEEWFPYLLAIAFVLTHHGLMGSLDPSGVINHPAAAANPWGWAAIHALFIAGLSSVNLVSWRLQEQERARTAKSEERLRWAFEDAPTGMAFVGLDGDVTTVNAALCRLTGSDAADLVGRPLAELIVDHDGAGGPFPAPGRGEEELRYRRRDGGAGWGLWHHSLILGDAGEPVGWVSHCVDISERKDVEQQLSWRASHDGLTGLPNRALFRRRVSEELERRRAGGDEGRVALLFVDLDNFKAINDSLGHATGDGLLGAVAARLGSILRGGDVLGRFGGDEFTILLPGTRDERDAEDVAARVVEALRAPLLLDDDEISVSVSVGLAFAADGGTTDPEALLRDADAAMYRAKALGKGRLEVFGRAP